MRKINIALLAACAVAVFLSGYEIGAVNSHRPVIAPENELAGHWRGSAEQAQDAIRRWSTKTQNPEQVVKQHWHPRSMFIPTRNQGSGMLCVELRLELGAFGGSPVYCYRDKTTDLVAEYSNVE